MNHATAILLAAGTGSRAGVQKQFISIKGKPVFLYSLEKLISHPNIKKVVVVVPRKKIAYTKHVVLQKIKKGGKKINIIPGGKTRQDSTYLALKFLKKGGHIPSTVEIHDAARPLITPSVITSVLTAAQTLGGAVIGGKALD